MTPSVGWSHNIPKSDRKLDSDIDEFIAALPNQKRARRNGKNVHYRQSTFKAYRTDLEQFAVWCDPVRIRDIPMPKIQQYLDILVDSGLKPSTINRKATAIRKFFVFIGKPLPKNAAKRLTLPQVTEMFTRSISREEIDALRMAARGPRPTHTRNTAMIEMLYGTGLRISELLGLNLHDISLKQGLLHPLGPASIDSIDEEIIHPTGKYGTERVIPIGGEASVWLAKWINEDRAKFLKHHGVTRASKAVFVNRDGNRISRQTVWRIINAASRKSGIEKSLAPHFIRDSFARHMMDNGATREEIDRIVGHITIVGDPKNTRKVVADMRRVLENTHPTWGNASP